MKRIGFIGAQSMHAVYFGAVLSAGVPGLDSASGHLWAPDTPHLVLPRLAAGEMADSCSTMDELLNVSDAVMILLRDGSTHRKMAESCLKRGKAVFVDKPFAGTSKDAAAILACAKSCNVPVMGGSTLCWLPEVAQVANMARQAKEITISFTADTDSPYGGWRYYGSHLTDLCAAIAGHDPIGLEVKQYGRCVEALVHYKDLLVRLSSSPEQKDLVFTVLGDDGSISETQVSDYERCYRLGMERFSLMLRDGVSVHPERLLFSTRLLDDITKTLSGD
ncbi:MAG: Gfo/Idh/MocA family oxidoreductase [Oscillospiraceae bacterium]|nr:Gfo/Idh/MocA family oxidoreductase [Oscillospiraceae bacterium]